MTVPLHKKIIIYLKNADTKNGIITWTMAFYQRFHERYEISILAKQVGIHTENIIKDYAEDKEYLCDILIHHYELDEVPKNIKATKSYTILHCDYGHIESRCDFSEDIEYIAVSKTAAQGIFEKYGISCTVINPFLGEWKDTNRLYRLISVARPLENKGINWIEDIARFLNTQGIAFQWIIAYSPDWMTSHYEPKIPGMIAMKNVPHPLLLKLIQDADYVVQLAPREGWCYAVHEALMMGTPAIVSDIPVFRDVIKNGYNGYRLQLNSKAGEQLLNMLRSIPAYFDYESNDKEKEQKWMDLFENE